MIAPIALFEVTRQCDRSCPYCYNGDRREPHADQLAPERLGVLLERICASGVREITIIGGEPLTVPQLANTVRQMTERGLRVGLSTNALTLDRQRIDELIAAGVRAFEISLDSPDPQIHALATGAPGVDRVRGALLELVQAPVDVSVGAVLTRHNVSTVDELLSFCFAINVDRLVLAQLAPVGQARAHAAELALTDAEIAGVCTVANARARELDFAVAIGLPVEPCRLSREAFSSLQFEACRCGESKWVVEPSGNVRTCELAAEAVGNLFDHTLEEIRQSEAVQRFRRQTRLIECDQCDHWPVCRGGCRFLNRPSRSDQLAELARRDQQR